MKGFANHCLDRMTYGATKADIAAFNSLGGNDDDRLANYVDEQLDWASVDDSAFEARMASRGYTTLGLSLADMWEKHHVNGIDRSMPARECERYTVARALHSRRQLLESLADFWHNHFNVFLYDFYAQSTFTSWDRDVIRPPVPGSSRPAALQHGHLMGNFRQMLELSSRHAAMQYYLDNYINQVGGPNENYAREVKELHTLGAENYAALADPDSIGMSNIPLPWGPGGSDVLVPIADQYVDDDVYAAMRMLTGWKLKDSSTSDRADFTDNGEFFFYAPWHDTFEKTILGYEWGNFAPAPDDIRQYFDLLAFHPGTARHIAGKLCRRFIGPEPSQAVINVVAQTFYDHRYASDQLQRTYRTLLNSAQFKDPANWGTVLKRPAEMIISAMRVVGFNYTPAMIDDVHSWSIINFYMDRAGHRPFYWRAPDGFPLDAGHWLGSNTLMYVMRAFDWMADRSSDDQVNAVMPILSVTQNATSEQLPDHSPSNLAAFWLDRVLGYTPAGGWPGTTQHGAILAFLRKNPDDPALWPADSPFPDTGSASISSNSFPYYVHERLRGAVKLALTTPDFLYR